MLGSRQRAATASVAWGRKKLLALVAGVVVALLALVVGLGLAIHDTLIIGTNPPPAEGRITPVEPVGAGDSRDAIAGRPLATASASAAHPGPLTTEPFDVLLLPSPRRLGSAGVSTGFPHTQQGALAQLVAIDQAALGSASVPGAQAVITSWAVPGGPSAQSWSAVKAIAGMLAAAGFSATGSTTLTISAAPALGLVKGTVAEDYVVACVDFVITATVTTTARIAAADCQRMVWTEQGRNNGRWMVGPGPEPAQPPSVWPGTQASHAAGYFELRYE